MASSRARPRPRRRVPQQDRSRATTEALIEAIGLVVAQHGVEGLTVRRVATRAGVAIGSVYQYYASSEALIAAWELRSLENLGKELMVVVAGVAQEPPPTLREAVRIVVAAAFDGITTLARHYRSSEVFSSKMRERFTLVTPFATQVAGFLEVAQQRASVRPGDVVTAIRTSVVAGAHIAIAMEKLDLTPAEKAAWRDSAIEMVVSFMVKDAP